jgi:glucosamine--fructose-6-phosphate aminotransferase (isomerizing)
VCGIFGVVSDLPPSAQTVRSLVGQAQQRGRDSSGLVICDGATYKILRADYSLARLARRSDLGQESVFFGHSRLVTNGTADNQPVVRDGIIVIHNGIIVNHDELWQEVGLKRELMIDTEIINVLFAESLASGESLESAAEHVLSRTDGTVACAVAVPKLGKLVLFSNNGSMYLGKSDGAQIFASERYSLSKIGAEDIVQVFDAVEIEIPSTDRAMRIFDRVERKIDLVPGLDLSLNEEKLLEYREPDLRRCTRCILPETMPFIEFDEKGICNYCLNYKIRNQPRPREELFDLVQPYRRPTGPETVVPFSGGRDSSFALHLIVEELKMRPVTYTYDWGMVTDLGRRNISRMCSRLGVENIIVAGDITKKRDYVRSNLLAWLESPNLGMLSVLTAGDKHFFRYIETVKKQTGVDLNLWGINPLEVTHFKAGFLGIPPDFAEQRVYSHGAMKQLRYQRHRLGAMMESPGYFNRSVWDTLSGEYFRSFTEKSDYFHIFDYWRWDESEIDTTLEDLYQWERAPDTQTTWRIGDGTAAFYNYAYYTIAGFTEHDTFRSNQIREGEITRAEALDLVKVENQPRYPNLKWYLDVLGIDFASAVKTINSTPRLY